MTCSVTGIYFENQASLISSQSAVLSWSAPSVSFQCIVEYVINTTTSNSTIKTDKNATEIILEPSAEEHAVTVFGVDYANRNGEFSRAKHFIFNGEHFLNSILIY